MCCFSKIAKVLIHSTLLLYTRLQLQNITAQSWAEMRQVFSFVTLRQSDNVIKLQRKTLRLRCLNEVGTSNIDIL